jgi:1-acyl-sn-glycerol-3-phosphate acyltransferase
MALATGAPLLPVRLLETRKALGRGQVGFPRLAVLIGEPIVVERTEPTVELARVLTDRLQAVVEALGT